MSASKRYWYVVRARYRGWGQSWCFGETPEAAVLAAVGREIRIGPPIQGLAVVYLHPDEGQPTPGVALVRDGAVTFLDTKPDTADPGFQRHMAALREIGQLAA